MGCIAEQFEAQGYPLKVFAERYKVYRQRRQEIETDPDVPQGFPAFLGRTVAKGGLRLARRVPVGGVVADFVDEEAFASLAGDFASYVARKISNKDEVRLVLEPVEVLTPLFLADLREVAEKHPVALLFDTYERTANFLDSWLRELLEGRHGDVPVDTLLVVAGRDELDRNHWAPYEGLLARLPLDPFTKEEARDYLTRKGITDERVVEVILRLSGRLPLLVATLAAESPDDPEKVGDPSGEAVERFLKWVEDPKQRQVALDAALPRRLNRDVLAVLVDGEEANAVFAWLRRMPFIERRGDCWAYHDVVRPQMLRYKRRESPQGWADLHGRLAEYNEGLRDGLGLEEEAGRKDKTWQRYALEVLYHQMCQAPQRNLPAALNRSLFTQTGEAAFSLRWSETIRTAGTDAGADDVLAWGQRLVAGIQAFQEGHYQAVVEMFTALLDGGMLGAGRRAVALTGRGVMYMRMKEYPTALSDFGRALELVPDFPWAIASRGETYRRMAKYQEALAEFKRAIELDPTNASFIAHRGVLYRWIKHYDKALADLTRAIELKPNDAWVIAHRGETYRRMGRYDEAWADFNRAIQFLPDLVWVIASRGAVYWRMGRHDDAQNDFDRAIELDPDNTWALIQRGALFRWTKRYDEALADLNRAIEVLKPGLELAWAMANRGVIYRQRGCCNKALADLNCAVELDPEEDWYLYNRALTYCALSQIDRMQSDITAILRHARKAYEKAPRDWHNTLNLALYYLVAGQVQEAERLYREALSSEASTYNIRHAVQDLDDLLDVFLGYPRAQAMRDLLQEHLQEGEKVT
jgi:tetratricopeptide (TPR) repeat protein